MSLKHLVLTPTRAKVCQVCHREFNTAGDSASWQVFEYAYHAGVLNILVCTGCRHLPTMEILEYHVKRVKRGLDLNYH